ncbi:HAMP domain-containing protein (plasmid) [Rhizobium leguminosarum]|uniref:sensor histidine kinase n=1 Tax=Rhizobium leguminosarum TaxID=384 RepID=UPI00144259B1|nr:ATP-binding protein [Rhizobium leguminosarum]MBY5838808.1 HAMP domain-containing protein [Rhizobium leguminosarum]NKM77860.1 HAMP domain-containing protein [Rhizobium leguminosarum bv. viciae]QSZ12642.1 HAMP domain-containing protein [Rhizobium leguminosarum]
MGIRSRILVFLLIVVGSVVMMAAVVYITIRSTTHHMQRVEWADNQLEAVMALTVNANRYSEQIAEFLLIGEPERPDYESARAELEAGFDQLEKLTIGEAEFLGRSREHEGEGDEIFRVTRMRALYREITKATSAAIDLRSQGRQEDAISVFRRDIENRFDAEFENILEAARRDEAEEVARAELQAEALWRRLTWITGALALAAVVLCFVAAFLLARSLMRPIGLLTQGTEAISRGELDHRIVFDSRDELGALARRFNEMAAHQEDQRDRLLNAKTELERQVTARTTELAAANQRLTDLDRLRVQFLADISHELRTPLTALRGEAEIPLRHGSKPEAVYRDALERIVTQSLEMSRLVDDLVFLSRSETDTIRFEPRRTDLVAIVADAVHEGEILGRTKGISIKADYRTDPVWVTADAQRLKQALVIILDNAIKYSPRDRSVKLSMTVTDAHAEIAIRDKGLGIPAEDIPKVFERFYRGRNPKASRQSGSGLGLSIAKWLIEKHQGEIELTSEVGSFTEVRLRIPCRGPKASLVVTQGDATIALKRTARAKARME